MLAEAGTGNLIRGAGAALAFLHALLAALLVPLCLSPDRWNVLVFLLVMIGLATPVAVTAVAARAWARVPTRSPKIGPASLPVFLFAFAAMWIVAWGLSPPSSHQVLGAGFLSSLFAAMAALYQLDRAAAGR